MDLFFHTSHFFFFFQAEDGIRDFCLSRGLGDVYKETASDAIASGADIYVTGDVKYHDFTSFADKIAIADIGHYESEQCSKSIFREILEKKFPGLTIKDAETDINTIKYI